jgi:hypothetical protein
MLINRQLIEEACFRHTHMMLSPVAGLCLVADVAHCKNLSRDEHESRSPIQRYDIKFHDILQCLVLLTLG